MEVRPLAHGSTEYRAYCELRRRELREPISLDLTAEDVAGEESQHLFGLFDADDRLIGGAIGLPDADDPSVVRMRQVVVQSDLRGQGLGSRLIADIESTLAGCGFTRCVLYARKEAAVFYERCGYERTGVTRQLIGLPHWEMQRSLGG